ncbi:MAG: hypothetical protein EXR94_13890 [Gemmatimonadetes bacterium]|nr:hypothetical protein [Gemmatimonadota bacterium]
MKTAVTLFLLVALVRGQAGAQVASVEVSPASGTVVAGRSVQLTARAKDAAGNVIPGGTVVWLSGPFEIAAVDQSGMVRAFRQGSLKVLARVGGKVGSAEFTVLPKPAVKVTIGAEGGRLVPGGVVRLTATATTEDDEPLLGPAMVFRSSSPGVASVDPSGVVTGRAPGSATITATTAGVSGSLRVEVIKNPVARLEVTGPAGGRTGDVLRMSARAFDRSGGFVADAPVRWVVSGGGATVYPDGALVAERAGAYLVNAIAGAVTAATTVTILPRVHDRTFETVGSVVFSDLQAAEGWAIGSVYYVSTIADRIYAFDISNPAAPVKTDSVMFDARIINDISTTADGKIGVVSRQGSSVRKNGIAFLDLSAPLHPKLLSEYTATVSAGVHSAFVDGHYVYLTDDGTRGMKVIDFQDPANPREVGKWTLDNRHAYVDPTGQTAGRYLHDIQVKDGLAYLAYFKDGVVILDVGSGIKGGSPANPAFVSRYTYNTTEFYPPDMLAGTHTVFRYGKYLVIGDEVFPQLFDSDSRDRIKTLGRLHVLDVTDIEHPVKVAEYSVPNAGSHNIWIENDVLYVGNFEAGVRAVDVSGELRGDLYAQGREIGSIWAASAKGFRPNVPMSWGAQPHRGFVYATDMNSGIWVGRLAPKRLTP